MPTFSLLVPHFGGGDGTNNFLIRRGFQIKDKKGRIVQPCSVNEDDERSFPEGKLKYRLHRIKERSRKLSKAVKDTSLREVGELLCDVCGFSFRERYGDLGDGYIEAHHTVAISLLKKETPTKVNDIALVCSNCHRMLHRKRPWLGMSELRLLINHKS
jgi:predicted HNH restriction endonuclease